MATIINAGLREFARGKKLCGLRPTCNNPLLLTHKHVGTAALGCPAEHSSAVLNRNPKFGSKDSNFGSKDSKIRDNAGGEKPKPAGGKLTKRAHCTDTGLI